MKFYLITLIFAVSDWMVLRKRGSRREYILYFGCMALVVAGAALYFRFQDSKGFVSTIFSFLGIEE